MDEIIQSLAASTLWQKGIPYHDAEELAKQVKDFDSVERVCKNIFLSYLWKLYFPRNPTG